MRYCSHPVSSGDPAGSLDASARWGWDASVPEACPVLRLTQEKERSKIALDPEAASEMYQRSTSFSEENSKDLILLRF